MYLHMQMRLRWLMLHKTYHLLDRIKVPGAYSPRASINKWNESVKMDWGTKSTHGYMLINLLDVRRSPLLPLSNLRTEKDSNLGINQYINWREILLHFPLNARRAAAVALPSRKYWGFMTSPSATDLLISIQPKTEGSVGCLSCIEGILYGYVLRDGGSTLAGTIVLERIEHKETRMLWQEFSYHLISPRSSVVAAVWWWPEFEPSWRIDGIFHSQIEYASWWLYFWEVAVHVLPDVFCLVGLRNHRYVCRYPSCESTVEIRGAIYTCNLQKLIRYWSDMKERY